MVCINIPLHIAPFSSQTTVAKADCSEICVCEVLSLMMRCSTCDVQELCILDSGTFWILNMDDVILDFECKPLNFELGPSKQWILNLETPQLSPPLMSSNTSWTSFKAKLEAQKSSVGKILYIHTDDLREL